MYARVLLRILFGTLVATLAVSLLLLPLISAQTSQDSLSGFRTVQPGDLLKELSDPKSSPTVVFVGFRRLYASGHIKGAQYHGTGNSADGLKELTRWASPLPRSTNLVIYCGCCPMEHCPNVRPAYKVLDGLGFTKVRILLLPTSFEVDWAEKGYAYDKGQ